MVCILGSELRYRSSVRYSRISNYGTVSPKFTEVILPYFGNVILLRCDSDYVIVSDRVTYYGNVRCLYQSTGVFSEVEAPIYSTLRA